MLVARAQARTQPTTELPQTKTKTRGSTVDSNYGFLQIPLFNHAKTKSSKKQYEMRILKLSQENHLRRRHVHILHAALPHTPHFQYKCTADNLVVSLVRVGSALKHLKVFRVLSGIALLGKTGTDSEAEQEKHGPVQFEKQHRNVEN